MHKRIVAVAVCLFLILTLFSACSAPKGVDVSEALTVNIDGACATLSSYSGSEVNIILPDTVGGKPVTQILPSFTEGKTFNSVELPEKISHYVLTEEGYCLAAKDVGEKKLPINEFTDSGIYCRFFNTDSIWVNGEKHNFNAKSALEFSKLEGTWQTSCTVKSEASVVYLEFLSEGTIRFSREGKTIKSLVDYTVEDGKIVFEIWEGFSMNPDDIKKDRYEMERIGDSLVLWSEDVVFYPMEDLETLQPESTDVWEYEEVERGLMITGYHGSAAIPNFPLAIDGKDVCMIRSDVADDYDFANISLNTFDFFRQGEDGYYYLNTYGGAPSLGSGLFREAAYCLFFDRESIIVNDRIYSYNPKAATTADFTKLPWTILGNEQHPLSFSLTFEPDGSAILSDDGQEQTGRYTYENGVITVTVAGKTATFDFMGDVLLCRKGSALFEDVLGTEGPIMAEMPYYTTYTGFANSGNWASPEGDANPHSSTFTISGFSLTFNADANSPIPSGTYDYRIRGNKLLLTGGNQTYTLKMEYSFLVDEAGRYYHNFR